MSRRAVRYVSSYLSGPSSEPLVGLTIPQVYRNTAEKFAERECFNFVSSGVTATFEQFEKSTNIIAAGLLAAGAQGRVWNSNSG